MALLYRLYDWPVRVDPPLRGGSLEGVVGGRDGRSGLSDRQRWRDHANATTPINEEGGEEGDEEGDEEEEDEDDG